MLKRVHIFVTGKVQGVYFRQTLKETAKKNDVSGWVRNLADGRVEAVLEGHDVGVDNVVQWAHAGPTDAKVESVQIQNDDYIGEFSTLDILY